MQTVTEHVSITPPGKGTCRVCTQSDTLFPTPDLLLSNNGGAAAVPGVQSTALSDL